MCLALLKVIKTGDEMRVIYNVFLVFQDYEFFLHFLHTIHFFTMYSLVEHNNGRQRGQTHWTTARRRLSLAIKHK